MRRMAALVMFALLQCAFANAAEAPATVQEDPAYTADLEKRGDGVLKELNLSDADKAARVKQIVMNQYRAIKKIDDGTVGVVSKDDKAAVAKAKEDAAFAKKPLHDEFLAKLSAELSPEQVETVKDKIGR